MNIHIIRCLIFFITIQSSAIDVVFYSVPKKFYEKQNNIFQIKYHNSFYPEFGNLKLNNQTFFLVNDKNEIIDEKSFDTNRVFLSNLTSIQSFNNMELRTSAGGYLSRDLKDTNQSKIDLDLYNLLKKLNVHKKQRNEKLEVCFTAKSSDGVLKSCLPKFYVRFEQDSLHMRLAKIVNDSYVDFNGSLDYGDKVTTKVFSSEDQLSAFIHSTSGYSIEFEGVFSSRSFINFNKNTQGLVDIISKSKLNLPNEVEISSIYTKKESSIFKLIGFSNSIGHFKPFYKYENVLPDSQIGLINSFGLEAKVDLSQVQFLDDFSRPKSSKNDFQISSYKNFKDIRLKSEGNITYLSNNVKADTRGAYWITNAEKVNIYNENILQFESNQGTHLASHLVYRTYPGQLSARISNTFTATNAQLLSTEYNLQYWFENIFGLENYYFSKQRWGLEAQTFQSLKKFNISDAESKYDNTSANFKYRFSPGVWNYDETVGLILGYQNFSLLEQRFPMMGVGLFWSRSMPRVFDDIINLIPVFRKQKWVSVDFTYYNTSLDKDKRTKSSNYKLNFYGKMLWTSRFFTEIGFGMRAHDLEIKSSQTEIQFQTYYGVFGLGLDF